MSGCIGQEIMTIVLKSKAAESCIHFLCNSSLSSLESLPYIYSLVVRYRLSFGGVSELVLDYPKVVLVVIEIRKKAKKKWKDKL